jgi:putative intracellular protease/amidase
MKTAYVLLHSGYADWEPASALAELRRTFGFVVRTIGLTSETVVSMGGLRVIPDLTLPEFEPESAEILILPGGDSWTKGEVSEVSKTAQTMVALRRPVAAICAATLALAYAGLLDNHSHTSNGKAFIGKYVPQYRGEQLYQATPAVSDRFVITANGLAPFAFAAEIFRALAPDRKREIETYVQLYSHGILDWLMEAFETEGWASTQKQLSKTVSTSVRLLFAFIRLDEFNGDVTPIIQEMK